MVSSKPLTVASGHGLALPRGYQTAIDLGLVNLQPWHFLSDAEFDYLYSGINQRYPGRRVIPFARRSDNDDVAGFILQDDEQQVGQVIVIHDFASPGFEVVARMEMFWDWFRYAVNEMIEWQERGE